MINRARPKYISEDMYDIKIEEIDKYTPKDRDYYFTHGRDCLYFFLKVYNSYYKKTAKVGIQDFTCHAVLEAIIKSGSTAVLFDVKLSDASISFAEVEKWGEELDVIVLTHYQGVPNSEYLKFSEYCKENSIILFEDMAHISKSYVDGMRLGTLSNAYLESYCFDKPFAAIKGGKLHINELDSGLYNYMRKMYDEIEAESCDEAKRDLELTKFLMEYTRAENFYEDFDHSYFVNCPWMCKLYSHKLWKIKVFRKFLSITARIYGRIGEKVFANSRSIKKTDAVRILFVEKQRHFFENMPQEKKDYKSVLGVKGIEIGDDNDEIVWNRYSIIDENGNDEIMLRERNICVGCYNWSKTLSDYVNKKNKTQVIIASKLNNSKYLSTHILNIPIWQL